MNVQKLLEKALRREDLSIEEGNFLYTQASLSALMYTANEIRKTYRPDNVVTWIIDRNVNITNVCISRCTFCNFHKLINQEGTYITQLDEYSEKIRELEACGGNQLLIQGGMHPQLGIDFYAQLFTSLKQRHPLIKLHALGPPEIAYIAQREHMAYADVLRTLLNAGMDSLPGAGAEILQDHIRAKVSPGKCNTQTWLDVMHEAHKIGIVTSATMMYGHIETIADRMAHLVLIRDLQYKKPSHSKGFTAFIPWPFYSKNTKLAQQTGKSYPIQHLEYIRMIAISRIMLTNIDNIQASWLTVGIPTAQICLHAGAHDMGSIMIEENVVSQAGAAFTAKKEELQEAIQQAGFIPKLRNQGYEIVSL